MVSSSLSLAKFSKNVFLISSTSTSFSSLTLLFEIYESSWSCFFLGGGSSGLCSCSCWYKFFIIVSILLYSFFQSSMNSCPTFFLS